MVEINCNFDLYEIPSDAVLQNRKKFYGLQRESGEQTKIWLNRVRNQVNCCEFPEFISYLLIDKFIGELASKERGFIRATADNWTLEKIYECFSHHNVATCSDGVHRNATIPLAQTIDQRHQAQSSSSLSAVKLECESVSKFQSFLKFHLLWFHFFLFWFVFIIISGF